MKELLDTAVMVMAVVFCVLVTASMVVLFVGGIMHMTKKDNEDLD